MIFLYLSIVINIQEPLQTTGMLCIEDSHMWVELSDDSLVGYSDYHHPNVTTICNIKGVILRSGNQDKLFDSVLVYLTFKEYVQKILGDKALITYIFVELHTEPQYWEMDEDKNWEYDYWDTCLYIGYYLKKE